jgi:hypothetical protein
MKKLILSGIISSMITILGASLAMGGTTVEFKFQSNPTDEQTFTATLRVLKHYKFDIRREDAQASSIRAVRKITKENVYYLEYSINIKEKQISVIANVTEYDPDSEMSKGKVSGGTVFGKTVSADKETRFSEKWRSDKEFHDASWLIAKVIRIIGTPLDVVEFKSQIVKPK